jgi:hypothetical protein
MAALQVLDKAFVVEISRLVVPLSGWVLVEEVLVE